MKYSHLIVTVLSSRMHGLLTFFVKKVGNLRHRGKWIGKDGLSKEAEHQLPWNLVQPGEW